MGVPEGNGMVNSLKLASLKNVSGRRRILPENEEFEKYQPNDVNMGGTQSPVPATAYNVPVPNPTGGIMPENYDVRANQVIPQQQAPNMPLDVQGQPAYGRLGRALSSQQAKAKTPFMSPLVNNAPYAPSAQEPGVMDRPIPQQAEPMPEELPPKNLDSKNLNFELPSFKLTPSYQKAQEGVPQQGLPPQPEITPEVSPEQQAAAKEQFNAKIEEAKNDPNGGFPVNGATDAVLEDPELTSAVSEYTGIDINDPEYQNGAKIMEAALSGEEASLNDFTKTNAEQITRAKERIAEGSATDSDKFYIGLALLMPLIVGGVFGKEAGLGALAGGAKAFGDILGERKKQVGVDEKALAELNKEAGELGEKHGKLQLDKIGKLAALNKLFPGEHPELKGMGYKKITDPDTGKQVDAFEIKPGFFAKPEYLASKEARKDMLQEAKKLVGIKTYVKDINDLTEQAIDVASQLKEHEGFFSKAWKSTLGGAKIPGSLSETSPDVIVNGEKQSAGIALGQLRGLIANAYSHAKEMGQLDRAAQAHFENILGSPESSMLSVKDFLVQLKKLREYTQKGFVDEVGNRGFFDKFAKHEMQEANKNVDKYFQTKKDINTLKEDKQEMSEVPESDREKNKKFRAERSKQKRG
jgi:hypothetical protein